jgi:hypothetical protein
MEGPKILLRALGTWVLVWGCALSAFSEPLKFIERQVEIPERGTVTGYLVSVDTNHFSFLPPPLWRASHKPGANSIAIISPDLASSIAIEFIARKPDDTAPKATTLLNERFIGSVSGEGFEFQTGLGASMAHDLHRRAAGGVRLTSRVVYVVTPASIIEFALTAPAAKFEEHTIFFAHVVSSFRTAGQ